MIQAFFHSANLVLASLPSGHRKNESTRRKLASTTTAFSRWSARQKTEVTRLCPYMQKTAVLVEGNSAGTTKTPPTTTSRCPTFTLPVASRRVSFTRKRTTRNSPSRSSCHCTARRAKTIMTRARKEPTSSTLFRMTTTMTSVATTSYLSRTHTERWQRLAHRIKLDSKRMRRHNTNLRGLCRLRQTQV
jgi:hypothetical protein